MPAAVPLFDVARALEPLRMDALEVFDRLTRSGGFTLGQELAAFEERFASFCGAARCVGVSDGTAALQLALLALGVQPGQLVVTVANTFVATVEAIAATGAEPVLLDVDPTTRCMDPTKLSRALGDDVAAVIPVHLYGNMAPMVEIMALCASRNVRVLEDAAQAHGASLAGRRAGAWGDAGAFSFYPTKNLGAWGDGGAVVCREPEVAETVRSLRHHGASPGRPNRHVRRGGTARLDTLQAALLSLRLTRVEHENAQRRAAAALYRELLSGLPLELPPQDAGSRQVYHLFVVEVPDRDRVMRELAEAGIATAIHYPTPVHLQPAWEGLGYGPGDFPVAERLAQTALSLPCFPGIREEEQVLVAAAIRSALHAGTGSRSGARSTRQLLRS